MRCSRAKVVAMADGKNVHYGSQNQKRSDMVIVTWRVLARAELFRKVRSSYYNGLTRPWHTNLHAPQTHIHVTYDRDSRHGLDIQRSRGRSGSVTALHAPAMATRVLDRRAVARRDPRAGNHGTHPGSCIPGTSMSCCWRQHHHSPAAPHVNRHRVRRPRAAASPPRAYDGPP